MRHAIDPVGGETGTALFRVARRAGRLILYGTLSGEPIQIDPRLMISGRQIVEGFWLGYWMRERSIPAVLLHFREIATLIRQGVLDSEIGHVYSLDQIAEAARTGRDRRSTRQGAPPDRTNPHLIDSWANLGTSDGVHAPVSLR